MNLTVEVPLGLEDVDCLVVCTVGPVVRATWEDPGDPGEVEIVEVREDAPRGALRPDLLAAAERDYERIAAEAALLAAESWDEPEDEDEERCWA